METAAMNSGPAPTDLASVALWGNGRPRPSPYPLPDREGGSDPSPL